MEPIIQKLIDDNKQLSESLKKTQEELSQLKNEDRPYQSIEIKDLITALAKARLEFKAPAKNKIVQFSGRKYEYSDLAAITDSVAPALAKHGIALVQQVEDADGGATILHTKLLHSSGQWMESRSRVIPVGKTQQEWGSAMTYQRRYNIMSLCAIAPEDEPTDDDGMIADKRDNDKYDRGFITSKQNPRKDNYVTITKEQLEDLEIDLADSVFSPDLEKILSDILDKYQIGVLADLPQNRYREVADKIRHMKALRQKS